MMVPQEDRDPIYCEWGGHLFSTPPIPGEVCQWCGVKYCPVAYDHNDDLDYCAVCGWENEGGSFGFSR